MIESYWRQLQELADEHDVNLRKACIHAGIGDAQYYRARSRRFMSDIHVKTARMIAKAIYILSRKPDSRHLSNPYSTLIDALVRRRRKMRISQQRLDNLIGCAEGLVGKWECGDRVPKPTSLLEWCQALRVQLVIRKH
jgi:DNA-binding transcriptional regulator YiaG